MTRGRYQNTESKTGSDRRRPAGDRSLAEDAARAIVQQDDHGGVRLAADGVVAGAERLVVGEDGPVVLEEEAAVATAGAVEEEHGGGRGAGVRLEVHDVLLDDPHGRVQVPALLEEDTDGAVVEHLRALKAVVQDEQSLRQRAAVVDGEALAVDEHLQALLADPVVHEQPRDDRAVEGVVSLAAAEHVDDRVVVA